MLQKTLHKGLDAGLYGALRSRGRGGLRLCLGLLRLGSSLGLFRLGGGLGLLCLGGSPGLLHLGSGLGLLRGLGDGFGCGIRHLVGERDLCGRGANAKEAGAGLCQDLYRNAVPVHLELFQASLNGEINGLTGGFD